VVAAGTASRFGGDTPKQYKPLHGKALLRHSVEALLAHTLVDQVCVCIHPDHVALYEAATEGLELLPPVFGGATRQQSVLNGLEALADIAPQAVLVHDAARPYLSAEVIDRVCNALHEHAAVIPATAVTDTIKRVENHQVAKTLPRDALVQVQTPQGFAYADLLAAHRTHAGKGLSDDAAVMEAAGMPIYVVDGAQANSKITHATDWEQSMDIRTGMGFDVHEMKEHPSYRTGAQRKMTLCGVGVPSEYYLEGFSDADVGLHAIVDALLGAISAGDIGQHFPPGDPNWKDADSADFTIAVRDMVRAKGGVINHVDVTLIAEYPKVGPYRDAMQQRVSELLEIERSRVSVKATTTEKLGFTGRGEGVAAQAVATVRL